MPLLLMPLTVELRRLRLWSCLKVPPDPKLLEIQSGPPPTVSEIPPAIGIDVDISSIGIGDEVELALDLRRCEHRVIFAHPGPLDADGATACDRDDDLDSRRRGLAPPHSGSSSSVPRVPAAPRAPAASALASA